MTNIASDLLLPPDYVAPMQVSVLVTNPAKGQVERLLDYVMGNLIAVISALGLFLGGLIMLVYLGSESYFPPDINASSIGLLFGAAAIIGIGIVGAFSLYLILPGMVYSNILLAELVGCENKEGATNSNKWQENPQLILFLVPSLVTSITFIFWIAYQSLQDEINSSQDVFSWIFVAVILVVSIVCACVYQSKLTNGSALLDRIVNKCVKPFGIALIIAILSAFPWLFVLQFAIAYEKDGASPWALWVAFLLMSILAVAANFVVVKVEKFWMMFLVAVVLLFFIILISHQWSLIPHAVVRSLSIGDIRNATLLLDEQGCEAAIRSALDDPSVDSKKGLAKCKLSSVTIVWRIGNEYWIKPQEEKDKLGKSALNFVTVDKTDKAKCPEIKHAGKNGECKSTVEKPDEVIKQTLFYNSNIRFSLPASHVMSWSVIEVPKEEPKSSKEK